MYLLYHRAVCDLQCVHVGAMMQKFGSSPGKLELVELDCSTYRSGLGVSVSGSRDGRMAVYVSEIQPNGAAAADGQIGVGDELLEVRASPQICSSYPVSYAAPMLTLDACVCVCLCVADKWAGFIWSELPGCSRSYQQCLT